MSDTGMSATQPNPGIIFETINAYQRSAALQAGIELDLFSEIGRGTNSVDALGRALKASPRGVRILCDYLVVQGFLTKGSSGYGLTIDSGMFLDRGSPAYFGSVATFLLDPRLTAPFASLAEVVRTGTTTLPGEGTVSADNPVWVVFAKEMAPMMWPVAGDVAEMLQSEGEMRVLDIAAGHGLFGIAVAQKSPKARITALDWPNVLAVAKENAQKMGVAERHTLLPGDAFTTDFGGPYDVVLVTNFFHHFDKPTCETLMRKMHRALTPGGCCVTLDFVPNEDRVSPAMPAEFALMMLGTTAAGDAYTFSEYQEMFGNAGFASSKMHPPLRPGGALIVSQRGELQA